MGETRQKIIEEAYRMFPDEVEPVDYHPVGKIVVDRGNLRFAFLEGARFATALDHAWDGPEVVLGSGLFVTCSRCGCDPSDDKAAYKCADGWR